MQPLPAYEPVDIEQAQAQPVRPHAVVFSPWVNTRVPVGIVLRRHVRNHVAHNHAALVSPGRPMMLQRSLVFTLGRGTTRM